jgi:chromosome segregation ATPase
MEDAQTDEDNIISKNYENVKQVKEMQLKSCADQLMITGKVADLEQEISDLYRKADIKEAQLKHQREEKDKLEEEIEKRRIEIEEKDGMIGEREKRIYNLKKKTQELEKFKFVLDYKIKELRKDIAPKTTQISSLKKQTEDMDFKLMEFNTLNANLGFMVDNLQQRQTNMMKAIT